MKRKLQYLLAMAAAIVGSAATQAEAKSPTPKKQALPGLEAQAADCFYTGKPYDEDLGGYVFNYRNYNPELKRWATVDPSGLPDGANNFLLVNNQVCSNVDPTGLASKSIIWVYAYANAEEPDSIAGDIRSGVSGHRSDLQQWDSNDPTAKYLSDGDLFHFGSVRAANQLGNFDQYEKMILFVHGKQIGGEASWNIGLGDTSGMQNEADLRYTTAELQSFRGNRELQLIGCGNGDIFVGDALDWGKSITTTYLYE